MKTLRIALVAMSIAALALPAGAAAKHSHGGGKLKGNAARLCKQMRKDMGADAFKAAYGRPAGAKNAFGKCVKQTKATLRGLRSQARQQCRTQPTGTQASVSRHGEGEGSGRAFHTCVAGDVGNDDDSVAAAEAQCQAELAADPVAFDSHYGSDEQDANDEGRDDSANDDFAECVDQHADADDEQDDQGDDQNQSGDQPQVTQPGTDNHGGDTPQGSSD